MAISNMLYLKELVVNDFIKVVVPTIGEILANEEEYYSAISLLTAVPFDMMVQLDDMGLDFTAMSDYELFLITFQSLKSRDVSLVFGDLDITGFVPVVNPQNGMTVLRDVLSGSVIDLATYHKICEALRGLHNLKRNKSKVGNEAAKKYLLDKERRRAKRRASQKRDSQLEGLIISVVNTEQFHYGYNEVRDLTIYQFNESVAQIIKKVDYENRMHGVYAGTLSASKLSQDELTWLVQK